MEETIIHLGNLLEKFQDKFLEIEDILHATNTQFRKLKTEYYNCEKRELGRENHIMSMTDFVSYMSALEEINDSSRSISEIPLDSDVDIKESTVSYQKQKRRISKSFSWQEVIHEEEEENIQHCNKNEGSNANAPLQRPTSLIPFTNNVKKFKSNPEFEVMGFVARGSIEALNEGGFIRTPDSKDDGNMNHMKIRIDPSHIILPNLQHPEVALLASATPSPMTPSEEKVPRLDLDMVNNNKIKNTEKGPGNKKKLHIKESKLPILTKAVLSPTSTPRNCDNTDNSKVSETKKATTRGSSQRNLTKTVTTRLLSSLSSAAKAAPVTSPR